MALLGPSRPWNAGYAYDNLNRMQSSPGFAYQNDVLGNRTWRNHGGANVKRYVWDDLNRLSSCVDTTENGAKYTYRADPFGSAQGKLGCG